LAGPSDKALSLNAWRGALSLLAQSLRFLGKAIFIGCNLCETGTLGHALLHPFEDWRERDPGVLITDSCHGIVR
jgi:hypothetical protein